MSRAIRRIAALAVLISAAAFGYYATAVVGPERLHQEVERWLARATKGPARVASLRVVLGFPIELEATGLWLWDGALTSERASARIGIASLLSGTPRLARLRLDGADLHLERDPEGRWNLPIIKPPSGIPPKEPMLAPLRVIESATRLLLSRPLLADALIVRRSRVRVTHPAIDGADQPVQIAFDRVNGRLLHSSLFGDARLFLRVHLHDGERDLGLVEWNGTRERDGTMQVDMAANRLELETFLPYLRGARSAATLSGRLAGVAEYRTSDPGNGRLALDLVVDGLETSLAADPTEAGAPLRVAQAALRVGVELDPERVALADARISAGELDFRLDAGFSRPLSDASVAEVSISLAELRVDVERAGAIGTWLPRNLRPRYASIAERVRSGRLVRSELEGRTSVADWRRALAGRLEHLPPSFRFRVDLEDLGLQIDAENHIDRLRGVLRFSADTLEVERVFGRLNGGALPELNVSFRGLSELLAAPPERYTKPSTTQALLGLTPLWEVLRPAPDPDAGPPPAIALHFEHLHHPALLWPMDDVEVELLLEPDADGVRMRVRQCSWAGVLLDGEVDWTLGAARRLDIALEVTGRASGAPRDDAATAVAHERAPPGASQPWASGHFEVGALTGPRWRQRGARGHFRAEAADIHLDPVTIELSPSGEITGSIDLDVGSPDAVRYRTQFELRDGDVASLVAASGAEESPVTGVIEAAAALSGSLVPGRPILHDANGTFRFAAREGTLARSVPPVFALALASRSLNPFSGRDVIRYRRLESQMSLSNGRLSTDAIELDGPDLRMFASGSVDFAAAPYALDTEVVLFLFRQLDAALNLIPIVNALLLDESQNLIAAYYEVVGSWQEPVATAKPLRTLGGGPTAIITKGIPRIVGRGMKAIGGIFRPAVREEAQGEVVQPEVEAESVPGVEPPAEVPPP